MTCLKKIGETLMKKLLVITAYTLLGFVVSTAEAKQEDKDVILHGGPVLSDAINCQYMNTSNDPIDVSIEVYCSQNTEHCADNPTLKRSTIVTIEPGEMHWQGWRISSGITLALWRCEFTYWGRPGQIKGIACNEFQGDTCTPLE